MALPRIIDSEPSCWTVLPYTCNACIEQIRKTGDKINGIVDPKIYCVVSCNTLFTTAPFPLHCAREDPWCKGQNYYLKVTFCVVGLGGLGVTCSPRDPKFAGSNPAEVDAFFSGRKHPEHKSSGRDFKLGVLSLKFQACHIHVLIPKFGGSTIDLKKVAVHWAAMTTHQNNTTTYNTRL